MIHIKSYLSTSQINQYEKYIKDFKNIDVDVYQLSKELISLGKDNVLLEDSYEKKIRQLERKYSNMPTAFISVKNLKELYYPRFELEERNSHNCYACHLKPYLYKDTLLPCKVSKVMNWGITNLEDKSLWKQCGKECDDCASIYENDMLDKIHSIIKDKDSFKIIIEGEEENDCIIR